MGATKDLFTQMREQEIVTTNFLPTKKEIVKSAERFARDLIDSGYYNITEKYAEARRLKEAIDVIESTLKKSLPDESFEAFGLRASFRNGGSISNYTDDQTYCDIKKQLDGRKALLDAALKTDETFYDSEGVEVPKVSITYRKSSLSVSF